MPSELGPRLTVREVGRESRVIPLDRKRHSVGRDPGCDVVLACASVAPEHLELIRSGLRFELYRLFGSPTQVNGESVDVKRLRHGDVIEVGSAVLTFEHASALARREDPTYLALAAVAREILDRCSSLRSRATPILRIRNETRAESAIRLDRSPFHIGYGPAQDLALDDPALRPGHAELARHGRSWELVDRHRSGDVRRNGRRVFEASLADGDEIAIGRTLLQFRDEAGVDRARRQRDERGPRFGGESKEISARLPEDPADLVPAAESEAARFSWRRIQDRCLDPAATLDEVLDASLEVMLEFTVADRAALFLRSRHREELEPLMARRSESHFGPGAERTEVSLSEVMAPAALRVAQEGVALVTDELPYRLALSQAIVSVQAILGLPLMHRGRAFGVLYLDRPLSQGPFEESERDFLALLAGPLGERIRRETYEEDGVGSGS